MTRKNKEVSVSAVGDGAPLIRPTPMQFADLMDKSVAEVDVSADEDDAKRQAEMDEFALNVHDILDACPNPELAYLFLLRAAYGLEVNVQKFCAARGFDNNTQNEILSLAAIYPMHCVLDALSSTIIFRS